MKAYSLDLRQKIIEAYLNQEGSIRQLAVRFKVAKSFIQKLIKRYKEEGTIEPLPHNGGPVAKLTGQKKLIKELVREKPDYTLQQLCDRVKEKTGISVSISTMCIQLQKLNLTTKKNF